MEKINVSEIKKKLSEKVLKHNWNILDIYINSVDFQSIIEELIEQKEKGFKFSPRIYNIFDGIISCPKNNVKVLIVGQDPYPQENIADGIAFSCSKSMIEQPSLKMIFNELSKIIPNYSRNPDLSRWTNQGVILLNYSLTCKLGMPGSHEHLWKFFRQLFSEYIRLNHKDCIIVLMGKKAQELEKEFSKVYKISHPASATYTGKNWNSDDIFNKINRDLIKLNKSVIEW